MLDDQIGQFEAVPPYPPRTEREAEFYSLRDGEMFVNMGPQHPSTHGVLRVVLKINGEQVVDLDPVLGYLHRGVEKLCENSDYHHIISQVDPLEYVSSLFMEWAPVMAFEKLLDVEVPRRAEYIRVLTGRAAPGLQPRPVPGLDGAGPGRPHARSCTASSSATRSWRCWLRSPASGCCSTTSASAASTGTSTTSSCPASATG